MEREQDDQTRHELDKEFDDIRSLLLTRPKTSQDDLEKFNVPEEAQYDQSVRELALDKRAQPKDRTKTEEELAQEEKEALERAERKRLKRMHGEPDDSSEEEDVKSKKRPRRGIGGDDLEDDFHDDDDWAGLGEGVTADAEDEEDAGEVATDGDDANTSEQDDSDEGSDEVDDSVSSENDDSSDSEVTSSPKVPQKRAKVDTKQQSNAKPGELPFTFPCPEDHDEFLDIVEEISDEDIPTVVKRIRALYHPSLAVDNKAKLQVRESL